MKLELLAQNSIHRNPGIQYQGPNTTEISQKLRQKLEEYPNKLGYFVQGHTKDQWLYFEFWTARENEVMEVAFWLAEELKIELDGPR